MIIRYHKKFQKQFKKLPDKFKEKVKIAINFFVENPRDVSLKNHSLAGLLLGKHSISVFGDVRIIFEEFDNYTLVIFLEVGTHNQVY